MSTMDYHWIAMALAALLWAGYEIVTLKVWPGAAVKLPPVKREPRPEEVWVMKRSPSDSPWREMPRVRILRVLDGWVEYRIESSCGSQSPIQTTIRAFVDVFEKAEQEKGNV